ncbi:helix-turn-helix domain-containing protein [Spirosoma foliorum]|uniref:Helix-turn-helix transcriptional regulator n=1 Tax=Spirosoma foliorum TaxID=2710596 RepID=A0A7G5H143_9BACT|nr:AraC family transcriptional regulator [Spirosoma foliorum]QMW04835.1 helix-turn-helix transcriptional regulator [Spirosoma foliorum]
MISRHKTGDYDQPSLVVPAGCMQPIRSPNTFLKRIYSLLERNLEDPSVNVDWLANQLGINRKTLYRQLKHLIQRSPTDLIHQFRLQRAVRLLSVDYTLAETSYLVGFNTPSQFTMVFKEFYQQTPTEYVDIRIKPG